MKKVEEKKREMEKCCVCALAKYFSKNLRNMKRLKKEKRGRK